MANQPRYEPLEASAAFADGAASRSPVPGTIARGQLQLDDAYFLGKVNGQHVTELPEQALAGRTLQQLIERGQERFTIYCSHCHGQVGGGIGGDKEYEALVGMVVRRGYPMPQTYHQDRLRRAPIGHFFDVMTSGTGRMPPHRTIVSTEDRWAIAAYIRVLQLSQQTPRDLLTPEDLEKLTSAARTPRREAPRSGSQ
jgi:mono/diheme cytochrome c family protein